MSNALLATTSPEGLQPLGSAPQRSYELVTGTLRDRLGAEHAALFAEPVASEHGDRMDWYAPSGGGAVPLPDLPEPEQAELRNKLAGMVGDIRDLAAGLSGNGNAEDRRLAEALENALEVPGEAMIWGQRAADGSLRPVLVHWAWIGGEHAAVRGVLTGMVPRRGATGGMAVAAGPAVGSAIWWWLVVLGWLLLAALLAAILWLLIAPCGLRWSDTWRPVVVLCPAEAEAMPDIYAAERHLQDRIAALRHELALLDSTCRPVVPVLPASPVAPVTPAAPDAAPEKAPEKAPETPDPPAPDTPRTESDAADAAAALQRVTDRGGNLGALNFVLDWSAPDDLDLYVTCPTGETVSFQNRAACGGRYDLDANLTAGDALPDPVENVVFDTPAPGIYKVRVNLRGARSGDEVPLRLHVLRGDDPPQTYSGTLAPGQGDWTMNLNVSK